MNMTFKIDGILFTAERSDISDREYEIGVKHAGRCVGSATCIEGKGVVRHLVAGQLGSGLLATSKVSIDATDFEFAVLVASNWLNMISFTEVTK